MTAILTSAVLACCAGCLSQGLQSATLHHELIRDVTAFYFDGSDRILAVEATAQHDGNGPLRKRLVLYDPQAVERAIEARINSKHVVYDTAGRKVVSLPVGRGSSKVLPHSIFEESYSPQEVPLRLAEMRRVERGQFLRAEVQRPRGDVESAFGVVIRRGNEDIFVPAFATVHRGEHHAISSVLAVPTAVADVVTSPLQVAVGAYGRAVMQE